MFFSSRAFAHAAFSTWRVFCLPSLTHFTSATYSASINSLCLYLGVSCLRPSKPQLVPDLASKTDSLCWNFQFRVSEVKASACNVGDLGSIPGSGRPPAEGNGNPLQYSCLDIHEHWSLVGYSLWGYKIRYDLSTKQRKNVCLFNTAEPRTTSF